MLPTILRIPLAHLLASGSLPLTRESVIAIARDASSGIARQVYVVVTIDHEDDGLPIEIATIELNSALNGNWYLQYVSHPGQSSGLTTSIAPSTDDLVAYLHMRQLAGLPRALNPLCAQDLDGEELGPLAMLNLRCGSPVPVVPSKADLRQLVALVSLESTR